jgi:dTDP-4-amino-4,6-dideoxygalactose transaminase
MGEEESVVESEAPVRSKPLPLEFPSVHYYDDQEIQAALRVLHSKSLFRYYGVDLQKETDKFEEEFARALGVSHALAVASGTSALTVALCALGVGPGQQVIVPAYMWVSVVASVVNQGAIPVLADIDDTFCLDPHDVERKITSRTAGIILVHMSGAPGNVHAIQKIATERRIFLLEDCAQCNGGSIEGQKVGTFGEMGIFSFQMNKNMSSGEGGCVVTNDDQLYRRAFACHDLGYARDENGRLVFNNPDLRLWGRGCRMDELRAAILRVQLRKLPEIIGAMRGSKYRIQRVLEQFPEVRLRKIQDPLGDTGCFLITTYRDAETARRVNRMLRAEGIVTSPEGVSDIIMTDWGLHLYYNNVSLVHRASIDRERFPWKLAENAGLEREYGKGTCPYADSLFERSILLPVPSCLTEQDEGEIIQAFEKTLRSCL